MDFGEFTAIVNCAAAADGGSLALMLAGGGGDPVWFVLDRSIGARGTERYEQVTARTGDAAPLTAAERRRFLERLRQLRASAENASCLPILEEFLAVLGRG